MKEYAACAINLMAVQATDLTFDPRAEVVVVWCEPTYAFDAGAELVRSHITGHFRIGMCAKGARHFAETLVKLADDLDKLRESLPPGNAP